MTEARFAQLRGPGVLPAGAALLLITVVSWVLVVRGADSMVMPGASAALADAIVFTVQWGVMMTAMMLPSAAPMILLYRTVARRAAGTPAIPVTLFAAIYLGVWLLLGLLVYAGYLAVARLSAVEPALRGSLPYAVAGVLVLAGVYQFTSAKRVCLRNCEMPLSFLMRRWRAGYARTTRIAGEHAAYCVGCCWALMLILVAAGAMSLPWVLTIALIVFIEKLLPHGQRTAQVIGVLLIVLGAAVAWQPQLAGTLQGGHAQMQMPMH